VGEGYRRGSTCGKNAGDGRKRVKKLGRMHVQGYWEKRERMREVKDESRRDREDKTLKKC